MTTRTKTGVARTAKPFDRSGRSSHHLAIRSGRVTMSCHTTRDLPDRRSGVATAEPSCPPPPAPGWSAPGFAAGGVVESRAMMRRSSCRGGTRSSSAVRFLI